MMVLIAALCLCASGASEVKAYEGYDLGCDTCHGGFRANPYTSLSDGSNWNESLHDMHRNTMLGGDCDTCHTGPGKSPVFLASSDGGSGLMAIACVGCHGRAQDDVSSNPEVTAGRSGYGAGLRQHHHTASITACAGCHADADPSDYTTVGEHILPPYYASPGSNHPSIPSDSCNPAGSEDFVGTSGGLDNDGDGDVDGADADCACTDVDTDGYSPDGNGCGPMDCDDDMFDVNPGATELCNGVDDDCSGAADDGLVAPSCTLALGVCAGTTASCGGAAGWLPCDTSDYGADYQSIESLCDGLDNDCDGPADEGCTCIDAQTQSCGTDTGLCSTGTQTCSGNAWGSCIGEVAGGTDVCDGQDNDCDGTADEDFPTKGTACAVGIGACEATGTLVCDSGGGGDVECDAVEGTPTAETCNGLDDDCNGSSDDRLTPPSCALGQGVCEDSTQTCSGASGWLPCDPSSYGSDYQPDEDRCDGLDNDCDGTEDEGCMPGGIMDSGMADAGGVDAAVDPDGSDDAGGMGMDGNPPADSGTSAPDAGGTTSVQVDGSTGPGEDAGGTRADDTSSGCSCNLQQAGPAPTSLAWAMAPLVLLAVRRRRRRD